MLDSRGQPLGAELRLAEIEVIRPNLPVGPAALPVRVETDATFDRAVRLVGYSLGDGPFKAGESLPITLFWASLADQPGPLTVFIELRTGAGQQALWYESPPIWPSPEWQPGDLLRDPHDLPIPPMFPPDTYELVVGLLDPHQARLKVNQADHLPLTRITTIDRPHVFELPRPQIPLAVTFGNQAQLIGLDLPTLRVKAGDQLPLTLHWQAMDTLDKSWTVFVHLINGDGEIVSQQDQIPGGGQYPTTGWLPHEYLADSYSLDIPAGARPAQGAYRLDIGLYDANDFSRLPVMEAGEVIDDHIVLESWPITIE